MCKQWHKQSNRVLTCVTLKVKTFRLIKRCHVSWRKRLKVPPIRLWHMSPIRLRYMSPTHPHTPINRSLPKEFLHTKTSRVQAASKKIQKHSEVQKLCSNPTSKPLRTSTLKSKNIWSRIIQTTFLDLKVCWNRAQKPPETSRNCKSVKLYGFKPQKPRKTSTTKPSKMKNMRRTRRTKNF